MMKDNKLWTLLNGEVEKTIKAIDELIEGLIEEYQLVTLEEKKEELILQKYWLLFIQDRLKKVADKGKYAGIRYHTELKQNIRSAIENNSIEGFDYCNTWSDIGF